MSSVTVIGDGLAGSMAALAAARERPSASVTLLSTHDRERDASASAGDVPPDSGPRPISGLIGVLGCMPDGEGPLAEPFERISDLPSTHPYRLVGIDAVRDGLALFDDVTGERYGGDRSERNALVPTATGRFRPTARYPDAVAAGRLGDQVPTSLVGFDALPAFDAPLAAERLTEYVPYRVNGLTVGFPATVSVGPDPTPIDRRPLECARALDDAERTTGESTDTADGNDRTVRDDEDSQTADSDDEENVLVDGLHEELDVFLEAKDRVGFPAVLGLENGERVRQRLADSFDLAVFEVPLGPPSIPGMRLGSVLADALATAGVEMTAAAIDGIESSDDHIDAVRLSDGERHQGEAFVLATGGVGDGGLVADRRDIREPVAECHLDVPSDRSDWARSDPLGDHRFASMGVSIEESLRPLTRRKNPVFENLWAAGRIIAGYDPVAEGSDGGVAVATGTLAGRLAAESLSE